MSGYSMDSEAWWYFLIMAELWYNYLLINFKIKIYVQL